VLQRHELQLFAAQDRERTALASTQAARQAIAKAEAKEREFQAKRSIAGRAPRGFGWIGTNAPTPPVASPDFWNVTPTPRLREAMVH
jgi:hypothetical protein